MRVPSRHVDHPARRRGATRLAATLAALALATTACSNTNQDADDPAAPSSGTSEGAVKVGLLASAGVGKAAEAMGISTLVTGDAIAQAEVLVEHLNADGGLAGRQIELVVADPLEFSTTDMNAAMGGACRQLAEDDQVELVVTYYGMTPGVMECFADAGIGVVDDLSGLPASVMTEHADHLAAPGDITGDRMVAALVDSLWERGWLTEESTIGVLSHDTAESVGLVDGPLTSALEAHGLSITEHQQIANSAEGIAQSGAAVLKFASAGVDRIIPVGANPLFLMQTAATQGYQPQYAVTSNFGPGALLEVTAPKEQLAGAAGIGWSPALDIAGGDAPDAVSENETLCLDLMAEAGQTATAPTAKSFQMALCNGFLYLDAAAEAAGSVTPGMLGTSRAQLGASFVPASTFATDVSDRVDGVAAYRDLAFDDACGCFQYGELHEIG